VNSGETLSVNLSVGQGGARIDESFLFRRARARYVVTK
jgi:hypothetical protein